MQKSKLKSRLVVAGACLALVLILFTAGGALLRHVREPSPTARPADASVLAQTRSAVPPESATPSGFRLLVDNVAALTARLTLADRAERTLDLQYYIFDDDDCGRLVAQRLLAAADRGVRVRILLDDLDAGNAEQLLDALDVHPGIEVRLFNPFLTRNPSALSKAGQFVVDGRRLNRRMHNKVFVADGKTFIVGGRNIGDAYYDADESLRFRDLDLVGIGPVAADAEAAFELYWNDRAAYPLTAFSSTKATLPDLERLRAALAHVPARPSHRDEAGLLSSPPSAPRADPGNRWFWGPAVLLVDSPDKTDPASAAEAPRIDPAIEALIASAHEEVLMISSYFVPGAEGTNLLANLGARGVRLGLLTNSLAANDAPAVHAGYARYRRRLLDAGVSIFELRPQGRPRRDAREASSSGVSLHAKALAIDRRYVFIGSMNMDHRSRQLNSEMGVVVDSRALAEATAAYFADATRPEHAYRLVLEPAGDSRARVLRWKTVDAQGRTVYYDDEPEASTMRRLQIGLLSLLPIDRLL